MSKTVLKPCLRGWLSWFTALGFTLFQFCLQLSSSLILDSTAESLSISTASAAIVIACYYYMYVLFQVPVGMMIVRFGIRRLLIVGGMISSIGCLLFASHSVPLAVLGRILMGGGCAFPFTACITLIERWFPIHYFNRIVAYTEMLGMLLTAVCNIVMSWYLVELDIQTYALGACLLSWVFVFASAIIIRDYPEQNTEREVERKKELPVSTFIKSLSTIFSKPVFWLNGIYGGLMFSLITFFSGLWGPNFLELWDGLNPQQAQGVCVTIVVGLALGSPIMTKLALKRDWFFGVMATLPLGAIFSFCLITLVHLPITLLVPIAFALGMCSAGYVLSFQLCNKLVSGEYISVCVGFTNALCMFMTLLLQTASGLLLGWMQKMAGRDEINLQDYEFIMSILPIMMILASVLAALVYRENRQDVSDPIKQSAI